MDAWTEGSDSEERRPVGEGSACAGATPVSWVTFPEGAAGPRCSRTEPQCLLASAAPSAKPREEAPSFFTAGSKAGVAGR